MIDFYGEGGQTSAADGRLPSLWTDGFSSCMEDPSISFSWFGAYFYKDNNTLISEFHGNMSIPELMVIGTFMKFQSGNIQQSVD